MPAVLALRSATAGAHERLSLGLDPERLCGDRATYGQFLVALRGFYGAVERQVAPPAGIPAPPIARSALLDRDLDALAIPRGAAPEMPWRIPLAEAGADWGVIYTVEGSALGGILLARLASEHLGIGQENGAAFFTAGASDPHRWPAVKAALRRDCTGERVAAAATAAGATFAQLAEWFSLSGLL